MPTDGFAPAKVNLSLHVTGQRADGYHLLDSLVVFADVGDRISVRPADVLSLSVTGPMADGLSEGEDNLVLRAARFLGPTHGAAITLEKHLPVASGLGGGSSDAAAALRVLARHWGLPLPEPARTAALGADVPVCLDPRPARMRGVGERVEAVPGLPPFWLVLANPCVSVPTPAVFARLREKTGKAMPEALPRCAELADLVRFLRTTRNDLQAPATALSPVIAQVCAAVKRQPGCLFARMSGSGATCFGMFATEQSAGAAASAVASEQPGWWVESGAALI